MLVSLRQGLCRLLYFREMLRMRNLKTSLQSARTTGNVQQKKT